MSTKELQDLPDDIANAIAREQSMPDSCDTQYTLNLGLEFQQRLYVRYADQAHAVEAPQGWLRATHDASFRGFVSGPRPDPLCIPQQVQLKIKSAPAELRLPVKSDRRFRPEFKVEVIIWHEGALDMPLRVKAYAVDGHSMRSIETWRPHELRDDVPAATPSHLEMKGHVVVSHVFRTGQAVALPSDSVRPTRGDPSMASVSSFGNAFVATLEFHELEFVRATRMTPVFLVFACLIAERDLCFVTYNCPTICICRAQQRASALARLGLKPSVYSQVERHGGRIPDVIARRPSSSSGAGAPAAAAVAGGASAGASPIPFHSAPGPMASGAGSLASSPAALNVAAAAMAGMRAPAMPRSDAVHPSPQRLPLAAHFSQLEPEPAEAEGGAAAAAAMAAVARLHAASASFFGAEGVIFLQNNLDDARDAVQNVPFSLHPDAGAADAVRAPEACAGQPQQLASGDAKDVKHENDRKESIGAARGSRVSVSSGQGRTGSQLTDVRHRNDSSSRGRGGGSASSADGALPTAHIKSESGGPSDSDLVAGGLDADDRDAAELLLSLAASAPSPAKKPSTAITSGGNGTHNGARRRPRAPTPPPQHTTAATSRDKRQRTSLPPLGDPAQSPRPELPQVPKAGRGDADRAAADPRKFMQPSPSRGPPAAAAAPSTSRPARAATSRVPLQAIYPAPAGGAAAPAAPHGAWGGAAGASAVSRGSAPVLTAEAVLAQLTPAQLIGMTARALALSQSQSVTAGTAQVTSAPPPAGPPPSAAATQDTSEGGADASTPVDYGLGQLPYQLGFTGLAPTPALQEYLNQQLGSLTRLAVGQRQTPGFAAAAEGGSPRNGAQLHSSVATGAAWQQAAKAGPPLFVQNGGGATGLARSIRDVAD